MHERWCCSVTWLSSARTQGADVWLYGPASDSKRQCARNLFRCLHIGWSYHLLALVRLAPASPRGLQQQDCSQYYIKFESKITITKAWTNIIAPSTKITISFHVAPPLIRLATAGSAKIGSCAPGSTKTQKLTH